MARSTAWEKHPEHKITTEPHPSRVRVEFGGETVAESDRALRLLEGSYPAVLYLPREDLRADLVEKTEHSTYCPFKGHASYYSIRVGDQTAENAIWTYEDPYDEMAEIRDYVAFYPDRVDAIDDAAS